MTPNEFNLLVKGMKAVYANENFIKDDDAFEIWYLLLNDLTYEQANIAIQKYMLTEKFPPTIADIRAKATEIIAADEERMSELQAWALVRKAVSNSGYNSVEEFGKLPKACQIAVGSPENLREWALMDSNEVETVEQSHFIRNYRTAMQRMKDNAKLPDGMKFLIADLGNKMRRQIAEKEAPQIEDRKQDSAPEPVPEPEHQPSGGIPEYLRERYEEICKDFKK